MTNRRSLVLALTAAALTPTVTFAAEAGDIFGGILQGIKDRKEREWYEKNRDEGRWDGKYFWDREDGKRYTRDEWRKELEWRYKEEKAGRDWRKERYGKGPREMDENKKRKDRDEKKRPPKPKKDKKPPRPKKDHRPDRREKDRR